MESVETLQCTHARFSGAELPDHRTIRPVLHCFTSDVPINSRHFCRAYSEKGAWWKKTKKHPSGLSRFEPPCGWYWLKNELGVDRPPPKQEEKAAEMRKAWAVITAATYALLPVCKEGPAAVSTTVLSLLHANALPPRVKKVMMLEALLVMFESSVQVRTRILC